MSVWMIPSVLVLALVVLGPLGAYTRLLGPERGFQLFFFGVVLALVSAVALAGIAAVGAVFGRAWRGRALRGALVPIAVIAAVLISQVGAERPPFNDVTTDLADPPRLTASPLPDNGYPAEWVELHKAQYATLAPIEAVDPPERSYARALELARAMPGWEVVAEDPATGTIAAVATSRLFGFHDDVAIRVRPSGPGSRIDLRSRSRFGRSDLGANATRIRAFVARFEGAPASR
jgi:uncharacterized protein (DUF1499 family)